jgi:DNA polymerase (family 10)
MVEAARARGYAYLAITDHSPGLGVARGLTADRVAEQRRAIAALNRQVAPFRVLHGAEINIRADGSLDYPGVLLRRFDFVVAAVHGAFDQPSELMTQRLIRALRSGYVDVLAHPTGRLLGKREGYPLDRDAVIQAARDTGVALEINSQPDRLDLDDLSARRAKEAGVRLAINTDAHSTSQLDAIRYGIAVARRAWLEPKDVLNTLGLHELLAWLQEERRAA